MKSAWCLALAVVVLLAGAIPVFATAQGEKASGAAAQPAPPINVLINSSPWLDSFKALVALYQKETGNQVNLDVTPFPGMLQKSRNAATAQTSEYDLINLNEEWYLQFYKGGLVTPLKEIDKNFKLDPQVIEYNYADRWDAKINGSSKDGEIYGLPINGNIQLLYYRTDLFKDKGLKPPTTFAEMLAAAKALHNPPAMYGITERTSDDPSFNLLAYINGFGGSMMSYSQQTGKWSVNIAQKPAVDALKFWLDLVWSYDPQNYTAIDQASMISLMASGRSAMAIIVDAAASNFDDPKVSTVIGKIGATVVPAATPELRSPISGIWVMAIPHNLPIDRKKAALAFLSWAMTQKAEQAYADAGGIVVREDVYQAMENNPKFWWAKAVADSTPFIKPFPRSTASGEIHTYLTDMLKQVVAKQIDPEAMLKQAAEKIQSVMQAAGYAMEPLSN
jgi:multiple sugar transport system substrate-binding protein